MKIFVALCLVGAVLAYPRDALYGPPPPEYKGNPDEWGPYFEGDMRFKDDAEKNGLIDERYRWPAAPEDVVGAQVPYDFGLTVSADQKTTIVSAYNDYTALTDGCITFVERSTEIDYVHITSIEGDGCFSYVGMIDGDQQLNYPQWCLDQYGSILHEMTHALGFFHMQSASDRDEFVIIHEENIQSGAENNFDKYDNETVSQFGSKYDYGSVMHYSAYAFSKNGEVTIETVDQRYNETIGQRVGLSATDIDKVKAMYKCP